VYRLVRRGLKASVVKKGTLHGFKGNGEHGFTGRGNDGPLARKIMGSTFQGKFLEVEGLGEHVQEKIGLLESNFFTLIQENIL
jgi:hypothetical protein